MVLLLVFMQLTRDLFAIAKFLYCKCLPISYLIDQRRLLFWKKMITSDNVLLRALAKFCNGVMDK